MQNVRNESEIFDKNLEIKDIVRFSSDAADGKKRSKRFIDIALSVIGLGFDIYSTIKGVQDDAEQEQKFNKAFEKLNKNYDAIKTNFQAIKNVEAKVDRITDTILKINQETQTIIQEIKIEMRSSFQQVLRSITELQTIIEGMISEMRDSFQQVLHSIKELQMADKISSLTIFIDYFWTTIETLDILSPNMRVAQLERSGGVLDQITKAIKPDGILSINLNHIINLKLTFPKNVDNNLELRILDVLYYGIQTYVSVFFVVLQEYTFLADFHYQRNNIVLCNEYFDKIILDTNEMKTSLLGINEKNGLIEKVLSVIEEFEAASLAKHEKSFYKFLQQRKDALRQARRGVLDTRPSIMSDEPPTVKRKPNFNNSTIETPLGDWKDDAEVSYAMQFVKNNTYSKIGVWSDPYIISGKASPSLRIPIDVKRRTRMIYRKFDNGKPQFIGVIMDSYQTLFRDINRDVYNAAKNFDEKKAMQEIEVLIENGADVNVKFEGGRKPIHAAAQAGNVNLARTFLLANNITNVDTKDDDGFTAMHIASAIGYEDFVDMLIEHNANICNVNLEQQTALHLAAFNGHDQVLNIFINKNFSCNINSKDRQGLTPIHAAVFGGLPALNTLLLNNLIDLNAKTKAGFTPLHLAVLNDYHDILEVLLKNKKLNVNAIAEGDLTALHFATIGGNTNMIRLLCSKTETDVNAASIYGWTPLHFASELKKEQTVLEILSCNGVKVNAKAEGNITSLHLAAKNGQTEMVLALLENGANIEAETSSKHRPIHFAAMHGHKNVLSKLIEHKANKEAKTNENLTPLMLAASSQTSNTDVLKYLLLMGADKQAHTGSTRYENWLFLTAKSNNKEIVKYVVENFDALNQKTLNGNRYLHVAAYYANVNNSLDILKYLIENGADINVQDEVGDTPLHNAAMNNEFKVAKYLIEMGANINSKDFKGYTPLHKVVWKDEIEMTKFLIENGANVNPANPDGYTALHYAAFFNAQRAVTYLIEKGANVDVKDNGGYTPLRYAAIDEQFEMVKLLIKKGANVNDRSNDSLTALFQACSDKNIKTIKFLVENGANIQLATNKGSTPLHMAAGNNDVEIIKFLLQKGADINAKDTYGYTPLNDAAANNAFETLKYLIEKGADINIPNNVNLTPLHKAAENNAFEMVKYLVENGAKMNIKSINDKTPFDLTSDNAIKTYLRHKRSIRDLRYVKNEETSYEDQLLLKAHRIYNTNEFKFLDAAISKNFIRASFRELANTSDENTKKTTQNGNSNNLFTAENLAFIGCIIDNLDNSASRRYHRLRNQGVIVIPNVNAAVHDARLRFREFVEKKIRKLEIDFQSKIWEELDMFDSEIVESLMRGVEFSGVVGLDYVLEECKQCFENILLKNAFKFE